MVVRALAATDSLNATVVTGAAVEVFFSVFIDHAIEIRDVVGHVDVVFPDRVLELHGLSRAGVFGDFEADAAVGAPAECLGVGRVGRDHGAVGGRALAGWVAG